MTPQEDWLLLASCADTEKERLAAQVEPLGHIASNTKAQANSPYAGEGPGATIIPLGRSA